MGILSQICKENDICVTEINGELCKRLGIEAPSGHGAGFAFRAGDIRFILYDGEAGRCEKEFIVAHELAHHLFGHLRPERVENPYNEMEANIFASVFVALRLLQKMEGVK